VSRCERREKTLLEYIELYLKQTPEDIDKLKKYFSEKNWNSLEITAHNMKSKAGYMGAQKLKELAELIEYSDKKSDLNKLNDLICDFAQFFESVRAELVKEKTGI